MLSPLRQSSTALVCVALAAYAVTAQGQDAGDSGIRFFEEHVRPLLVKRCYECHSEESGKRKGGLWLDRKAGWQQGGDSGEAIIPGDVDGSLLVYSVQYHDPSFQMPPKGRLPHSEIAVVEKWVAMGAPDPRTQEMNGAVREGAIDYEAGRRYWAFQPLSSPEIPPTVPPSSAWSASAIDRFVWSTLRDQGLEPAAEATPRQLIRRLYYDLTGLPPTPGEVDAFVEDDSNAAWSRLVDDLLSRKSFGEKWGKHWLDVARYADSNGGDRNFTFFHAWRYRNYVIGAFNCDKSYYDFVREQIAGDLLPAKHDAQRREQMIASTFLALGPKMLTERDKEKLWLDTADEQIDTTGRAFLGLTLGCARCHDHKFDPISQEDYYALAGIFRSTEVVMGTRNGCVNVASWVEQPLPGENSEELAAKTERLELAMKLTVEKVYNEKSGNQEKGRKLSLMGIIADTDQAQLIGKWRTSTLNSSRYGDNYVVSEGDDDKAIFQVSLPQTGVYAVRVAYSGHSSRCASVPIVVENHESKHPCSVDQTKQPDTAGLFQQVGCFLFEKDNTCKITFECKGTQGYVIVDAVQLIRVDDIGRESSALEAMGTEIDPLYAMSSGDLKKEISRLLKEFRTADLAMTPRDLETARNCNLRVRGEVHQIGPLIRRGFPKVLSDESAARPALQGSGRLELAHWLVHQENGLVDRVIVNRVWHHLFDRGIVATVDNFGRLGEAPTHPELLDWLAAQLRRSNGSLKSLIRDIVLSRAYRMSCDHTDAADDPENHFFSRQNRRRLSAEEIRDSILFLSGALDQSVGKATATPFGEDLDEPMNFDSTPIRTVYLPVARNNAVAEMALFDAANPDLVDGNRPQTIVPTQALYLLNSESVQERATSIAATLPAGEGVDWFYETILSRPPTARERTRAETFIAEIAGEETTTESLHTARSHFAHLLVASTEFLFLD